MNERIDTIEELLEDGVTSCTGSVNEAFAESDDDDKRSLINLCIQHEYDECDELLERFVGELQEHDDESDDYRAACLLEWYRSEGNDRTDFDDIDNVYDNVWKIDGEEYLVVTDDEGDALWDDSLDNYLDECVLSELDGIAEQYFDRERWKKDARMDGRAHSLNHYDGDEAENRNLFFYRQN